MRALCLHGLLALAGCQGAVSTSPAPSQAGDAGAPGSSARPPPAAPRIPASPADPDTCQGDADCVVTNFAGCCACPQCSIGPPRALSRAALRAEQEGCKDAVCNTARCGVAGICPPGEDASRFAARCRDGACRLERPGPR
jgi:hypothetical protein